MQNYTGSTHASISLLHSVFTNPSRGASVSLVKASLNAGDCGWVTSPRTRNPNLGSSCQETEEFGKLAPIDLFFVKVGLTENDRNFDVRLDLHLLCRAGTGLSRGQGLAGAIDGEMPATNLRSTDFFQLDLHVQHSIFLDKDIDSVDSCQTSPEVVVKQLPLHTGIAEIDTGNQLLMSDVVCVDVTRRDPLWWKARRKLLLGIELMGWKLRYIRLHRGLSFPESCNPRIAQVKPHAVSLLSGRHSNAAGGRRTD